MSESFAYVPLLEPKDKTAAAYVSDAVDMGKYSTFTAYIIIGAVTGDSILTVNADTTSALATALTTPIIFKYRLSAGAFKAASADVFGEPTAVATVAGLTLTAGTYANKTVAIEIDSDTLGSARWVTFNLSSAGNPMLVAAFGVGKLRYPAHVQATTLV
jgi:hypothetical protein